MAGSEAASGSEALSVDQECPPDDRTSGMKLRHHPLMVHQGLRSWPPSWVCVDEPSPTPLSIETGFLTRARMFNLSESKISIRMRYEEAEYVAHLSFDDHDFCLRLYAVLRERIGSAIKDIADTELD